MRTAIILTLLCGALHAAAAPTGRILCQYWRQIPGGEVADLTKDPAYPRYPSEQAMLESFEIPPNQEPEFGTVVRGWVHPPVTGEYTFWIAGDNQCELWLSDSDNSAAAKLIATVPEWSLPRAWEQSPRQKSARIKLEAGKRYYIEARHKDSGGDNSLAVAWTLPDGTLEAPIPGKRLSPAEPVKVPPPQIVSGLSLPVPPAGGISLGEFDVEFRARRLRLPVVVRTPHGVGLRPPVLCVFGPASPPDEHTGSMIVAEIGRPDDSTWKDERVAPAVAEVLSQIVDRWGADPARIYLAGSGNDAVWRVAMHLRERPAAIVAVGAHNYEHADLPQRLNGVAIRMIAGVKDGMNTDRANRMHEFLSRNGVRPEPQIEYEMEMGEDVAARRWADSRIYEWLTEWRRPGGQPAVRISEVRPRYRAWLWYLAAGMGLISVLALRHRLAVRFTASRSANTLPA